MKYLPCIKDKCLKYPACKHKCTLSCELVRDYYQYYKREKYVRSSTVWRAINIVLPNAQTIIGPLHKTRGVPSYYYQKNIMNPNVAAYYDKSIDEEFNFDTMYRK